ncbi:MAG: amino acid permease [Proteobacteria bacterium]|nr:amino acid permease [Pseudomonadota bacterium]
MADIDARPPKGLVRLSQSVSLLDAMMLAAGSALGQSIFSVLAPAAGVGGSGILITIGVSAIPMAVFAVVYSFLSSAAPRSGASFVWPFEFISPFAGFMLTWLRIFGQVGQLTTISVVLIRYLGMVYPLPLLPSMFGLFTVVFILNYLGIGLAARTQTVLMGLLLSVFAAYVATGAPHVLLSNILPLAPHGPWPILLAAPLMVTLFTGIEAATEIGEEVKDAERNVPLAIAGSLLLISAVYFAVTFVTLGLIGPLAVSRSQAPLIEAARHSISGLATPLILFAATISLLKSLNASFLLFSRSLFAMGRAGVLPVALGRVSPRRGTPRVAVVVAFLSVCCGLFLPKTLIFLFLASNIPTILKYFSTCCCAISIAARRPEVFDAARLKMRRPVLIGWAGLGCVLAACLFFLGTQTDWKPYALIGGWAAVGVVYWMVFRRARQAAWSIG